MSKIQFSSTAIMGLADFVLNNYEQIKTTIKSGIDVIKQTCSNIKLTYQEIEDLFKATAEAMQSVENTGELKGSAKKAAVFEFIEKEYVETKSNIKQIWSSWKSTISAFIDQLIEMLNAGRSVLSAFLA